MESPVQIRRWVLLWLIVMSFLSPMVVAGAGVWYTTHTQNVADKRWCNLFASLDVPVSPDIKDPVQRARSIRIQSEMHRLRQEHGCIK